MRATIAQYELASAETPVLLMVSGGSDSTALAYLARKLHDAGEIGELAMLHVNHQLRGEDADADALFAAQLAELLEIPLFMCELDIAGEAARTGGNVEAVARHERYVAANEALRSLCHHAAAPIADGRIFTAHTADDRVENFYMRSIVGTGPGGFRSMRYQNGPVTRPLMDVSREDLRAYLAQREADGLPMACDAQGRLWREDATNAHTDRFRAFVRHEIVPRAKERNERLLDTLCRTMNLIADEDDMLETMAGDLANRAVEWTQACEGMAPDYEEGCVMLPEFGAAPLPLQRRACFNVLQLVLGADARVETASVDAVLAGFERGNRTDAELRSSSESCAGDFQPSASAKPKSGYVTNIQGDLAVSANKKGVRIEPMAVFRARRKKS
ncbi:MAG: tRNA lysidine(34) synthetase TilS [Eggerthellaceae bacterium]|nr:tRNA lysidine(34) synthetase TilS [Eggerthellaceae bacterium]